MKKQQTGLLLSSDEEARLLAIAKKHRSLSRHGRTSGEPSWRVLIHDIAEGRLAVVSATRAHAAPEHKQKIATKPFVFHRTAPPRWWNDEITPDELSQKTGMDAEQLTEEGFGTAAEFATPPAGWDAWRGKKRHWFRSGMLLSAAIAASRKTADELLSSGYVVDVDENENEILIKP